LVSDSFSNLSLICLDVTNFHSLPANGELFTKNSIFRVGSSIVIAGMGFTSVFSATVSHTYISAIQAIVIISQATASFTFTFSSHSFVRISVIFAFLCFQSLLVTITSCHTFIFHS
jgi:hypothetical protein